MGPYWERLLAVERRLEVFRRIIVELRRQVAALQQQLRDQRGT
jgi:hypothetical protein